MQFEHRNAGFALVTVLLLMGFLVSLILGISVLLRVEFQLQDNIADIKKAKANARIALRTALGEIQEKLGPDGRITVSEAFLPSALKDRAVAVLNAPDGSFRDIVGTSNKRKITNLKGGIDGLYGYSIEDLGLSVHFNDSLAVLANPRLGCLKKDLSDYLSMGNGLNVSKECTAIFEDSKINKEDDYIPKWELVRDFYELSKSYNNKKSSFGKSLAPRGFPEYKKKVFYPDFDKLGNGWTTPSVYGLGPVIVGCSFGFSPEFEKDKDGNFKNEACIKYFVTVALWNPYDFSLESEDYVFQIEPKGSGNITIDRMPPKAFKFGGSIRHQFAPGEVQLFSLFSGGGKANNGNYNLLITHPSSLGSVVQEQKVTPSNQRSERRRQGGGRQTLSSTTSMSDAGSTSFYRVSWGDRKPTFSLLLLSSDEQRLYQEIHRLKLEKNPFSKDLEATVAKSNSPLFSIIFKNSLEGGQGTKDYFKNFNPRAPVARPTKNMYLPDNPYRLNTFVDGASNNSVSWKLDAKDFPDPRYNSLFSMPEKFESLGFLRHINFGPLERHAAFAFGNSFGHSGIPRNAVGPKDEDAHRTYFYDYSYKLNENLWDDYFLSGKRDYPKEVFEKNFVKLNDASEEALLDINKCAGCLLLKGAFNVNSASVSAWTELLFGLQGLSKTDIERLALEVVKAVKERGPFCSLGSFVNRRLEDSAFGDCGAIQAALNEAQIDKTQAEVLEAIGHRLTVRSDSFIVRAYGEATHPFTGEIKSRACCEALVQRVPEYLESSENSPEDVLDHLSKLNKQFGRRFKIISFRWVDVE